MKKTIQDITEEVIKEFNKNDKKIIRGWNFLFEEEQIQKENLEDASIKDELIDEMIAEIMNFVDFDKIEELYEFTTGNDFPEIVTEENDDYWDDDWEQ